MLSTYGHSFKKVLIFILRILVFCLHACLGTMCVPLCQQKLEESARSLGTVVIDHFELGLYVGASTSHVGAGI